MSERDDLRIRGTFSLLLPDIQARLDEIDDNATVLVLVVFARARRRSSRGRFDTS